MLSVHPRGLYRWNTVDIQGQDGLFQHGRVVNVVFEGLVVDFDCPGRRTELVSFDAAFHCYRVGEYIPGDYHSWLYRSPTAVPVIPLPDVEILARVSPEQPWKWYPARLSRKDVFWRQYVFVEITLDDTVFQKLVGLHCVRVVSRRRSVKPGDFIVSSFTDTFWGTGNAQMLLSLWKESLQRMGMEHAADSHPHIYPVGFSTGKLMYLQPAHQKLLGILEMGKLIVDVKRAMQLRISTGWTFGGTHWIPAAIISNHINRQSPDSLAWLPANLLQETFQYLDSINRIQCRRVCAVWDTMATTGANNNEVWVTFTTADLRYDKDSLGTQHEKWRRSAYMVGLCLWKTVTATTKWVIITNAMEAADIHWSHCPFLGDCLRVIELARQEQSQSSQKVKLILHRFHWRLQVMLHMRALSSAGADAAAVVQSLTWTDCRCTVGNEAPGQLLRGAPIASGTLEVDADRPEFLLKLYSFLKSHLPVRETDFATLLPFAGYPYYYE